MLGHESTETIACICPHHYTHQIAICTVKLNITIFDLVKNRSIRALSVAADLVEKNARAVPIAIFYVDDITCRSVQNILGSKIQKSTSDAALCLVLQKGAIVWDQVLVSHVYIPFGFTATCAAQAPDALILGDAAGKLWALDIASQQVRVIGNTQGPPAFVFTAPHENQYGLVTVSAQGVIELFSSSGAVLGQMTGDAPKNVTYDAHTNTLFVLKGKKSIRLYNVTPVGITRGGECGFNGFVLKGAKPVSHVVQVICPCHMPIANHGLFFAICDQSSLFVGGSEGVLQKVTNFPARNMKRATYTTMMAHPTDMSLVMLIADKDLIILDMFAHMPQVIPSKGLPKFVKDGDMGECIANVKTSSEICVVINRSTESYVVYDKKGTQIDRHEAFDVVIGPGRQYAHLKCKLEPGKKKDAKKMRMFVDIFDGESNVKSIPVVPPSNDYVPLRMISFGEYFAVIVGNHTLSLSFCLQKARMDAYFYRWDTLEPIALHLEGAAMVDFEHPYIAVASPNAYSVFEIQEDALHEVVTRQKRLTHLKLHMGQLYTLTQDGLELDDFNTTELLRSRFWHLATKDRAEPMPVNVTLIDDIRMNEVVMVDTTGRSMALGIPYVTESKDTSSVLLKLSSAGDLRVEAGKLYKDASGDDRKRIMLTMIGQFRDGIESVLSESEKALFELAWNSESRVNRNAFDRFLATQLEIADHP